MREKIRATTILGVLRDGRLALGGDGQVTLGDTAVKHGACKIRRLLKGKVLSGFAGSAGDAITLFERFEGMLEKHNGQLLKAAVEMAKEWRSDRVLRRLEAMLIVGNLEGLLILSGNGDVIEPDEGIASIGSGSAAAQGAARALIEHSELEAEDVVRESLLIASKLCIYTNDHITVESLPSES